MAEYYAVLSKAVASLEVSTPESRRAVYDKARNALIGQLKAIVPPLPTSEISRQRLELEEAIRRAEREASAAGSSSARPVSRPAPAPPPPPAAAAPPPPPPPPVREVEEANTDDGRPSPQDVFRRAIQEAESRGAQAPPIERAPPPPPRREYDDDRVEIRRERGDRAPPPRDEPPPYVPAADYRSDRRPAPAPRLAPDYDWEASPSAPPPPPQQRYAAADPYVDDRDRPSKIRDARRRGNDGDRNQDVDVEEVRPSRLPTILLLGVIIAMVGGLAALAWSQREMLREIFAFDGGGTADTPAPAPQQAAVPAAPAPAAPSKDADRLPGTGPAPADSAQPGVRVVAPNGAIAAAPPAAAPAAVPAAPGALIAQKATLYEEPLDAAAAAKGVTAISGSVTWSYVADGPDGPTVVAQLDIPQRKLKVKLSIRRNLDKSLPASHIVDIIATVPPDFPGKGIKSVPRLVMKPAEEQRGQPLVGYPAQYAVGIFGIGLSSVEADVKSNLGLMRDRGWIDLPLVYDTGQRAIVTFERGNQGDRAFQQALAAWGG
jgi:hypothetical protein